MRPCSLRALTCALATTLAACEPQSSASIGMLATGKLEAPRLDEVSGIQAAQGTDGAFFVHNDDGEAIVHVIDAAGSDLGAVQITGAENRDWEDITTVPSASGPLLVVADIGDNLARHETLTLYFVAEPLPGSDGRFGGESALHHRIRLTYPDGPRDAESLAWDAAAGRLLIVTKRDKPPRIYGIPLASALASEAAELAFLGETVSFRRPASRDLAVFGERDWPWISQPTGFDISPDGRHAAIISYRSVYLFERAEGESWPDALTRSPLEFEGPPSRKEEAIGYSADGAYLYVTSEGTHAPVYRVRQLLPGADNAAQTTD
ncbi:MAG: hypothetical protein GTN86_13710 [Xanthomonadales bacterium]|nr:hypothetical protein [Xanthomonadales bacterium]NIN60767.1 hypothetical protein [Xanthomonadales bacterium]NIN76129.1 hypothetical protein [Xanthomonadales bacterium]NIO15350.1 hypothetical protein [Xanthomonadales bacterium]NIP13160.1 hypothetical protein [Xanthomonadales bacterium]